MFGPTLGPNLKYFCCQWRIQDFRGYQLSRTVHKPIILQKFCRNCMKMKEFGPRGGASLASPWIRPRILGQLKCRTYFTDYQCTNSYNFEKLGVPEASGVSINFNFLVSGTPVFCWITYDFSPHNEGCIQRTIAENVLSFGRVRVLARQL